MLLLLVLSVLQVALNRHVTVDGDGGAYNSPVLPHLRSCRASCALRIPPACAGAPTPSSSSASSPKDRSPSLRLRPVAARLFLAAAAAAAVSS